MPSPNAARAVPAAAGDDPRDCDLAGELIGTETTTKLPERQAAYVERRFLLPAPIARAVAEIHFGRAAA